jgi:hypothetical protein
MTIGLTLVGCTIISRACGIVVRQGGDTTSAESPERHAPGAIVHKLLLQGEHICEGGDRQPDRHRRASGLRYHIRGVVRASCPGGNRLQTIGAGRAHLRGCPSALLQVQSVRDYCRRVSTSTAASIRGRASARLVDCRVQL